MTNSWKHHSIHSTVLIIFSLLQEEEPFSALCAYASDAVQSGGSISAALKKSGGKGVSDGGRVDVIHTVIKKHGNYHPYHTQFTKNGPLRQGRSRGQSESVFPL